LQFESESFDLKVKVATAPLSKGLFDDSRESTSNDVFSANQIDSINNSICVEKRISLTNGYSSFFHHGFLIPHYKLISISLESHSPVDNFEEEFHDARKSEEAPTPPPEDLTLEKRNLLLHFETIICLITDKCKVYNKN
jgi:hypothetical protein